jgi:DNA repair exonuclease SbcCD ATPase subunit
MGDTAETQSQLAAAIARLDAIAAQLERPVTATPVAEAPQVAALTKALQDQGESIRNEIRDLAVRLTEDRLLAGADMPFLTSKAAPDQNAPRQMTLADVPGAEIMSRLQNLAAEMNAAQSRLDHAQSLKDALGSFATEVKTLAANADRSARMRNMGKALEHHADEIETHAKAVEPSSGALRNEIHAITSELRTVAARAQSNNVKDASTLREAAIDLGARAESLFSYFENAPSLAADDDDDELAPQTADAAAADLQALAQLIGRIEARAEHLSQAAVAARFAPISDDTSPAEREAGLRQVEQATDGAVHAVFASIERLNNIAAALARAGEIERRRHAAH